MPDLGPLYVPGVNAEVSYSQYAYYDFGDLYSISLGEWVSSSGYMDPAPPATDSNPFDSNTIPLTIAPSPVLFTVDNGPADIFASLPPLFVAETPPTAPSSTITSDAGGGSVASSGVIININNTVKNTVDVSDKIGAVIAQGIEVGADAAAQVAADTAHTVTQAVGNLASQIFDAVKAGAQQLWDWLTRAAQIIAQNAGQIISFLGQHLSDIGKAIVDDIQPVMSAIAGAVDKIATVIQKVNDDYIQPITTTISKTLDTVTSLTKAIETDLHDGLKGLLQIPSDVAGAMTSLDATMQRTVDQLGAKNKEAIDVNFKQAVDASVGIHLDLLNQILSGHSDLPRSATTFSDHVTLPEPGASEVSKLVIEQTWGAIKEFVGAFMHGGKDVIDDVSKGLPGFAFAGVDLVQLPITLVVVILTALAELKPILEWMEEDAAGKAGLAKLQPQDALAAWVRNFISTADLTKELEVNGWDAQRIQVMKDLQQFLIDIPTALDMFYRGIMTEDDLRENLYERAVSKDDADVMIAAGYKIFGVDTAMRMWRYGRITDDELKTVLRINRYTEEEVSSLMDTALRPPTTLEYIANHKADVVLGFHLVTDSAVQQVPDVFVEAAKTEGVNSDVAKIAWRDSFLFPQLQQWMALYFRGIRTHEELMAAMEYYRIPTNLRDDYIQASRALIPFRTIPAMLASGIISEAYAKQQLQAHGYDLQAAEFLLAYAAAKANKVPAASAATVHQLSLSTALDFFRQGAITVDQYHDILVAHGDTESQAALAVSVEVSKQAAEHRKQTAQDIVDEALAGLITSDQAAQQLAQNNFSAVEIARYTKRLRSSLRKASKIPSEPDLVKMAKNDIISMTDYANALAAHGYANNWVQALVEMNFPAKTLVTEGA